MIGFNSCLSANHISTEVKLNNSTRGEKQEKKSSIRAGPWSLLAFESDASAK